MVRAIDIAPFMIERSREEVTRRGSKVEFIVGNALQHDLGTKPFDLVAFPGNTVPDFPLEGFVELGAEVWRASKRGGRYLVHYIDGIHPFIQETHPKEGVQQETPVPMT